MNTSYTTNRRYATTPEPTPTRMFNNLTRTKRTLFGALAVIGVLMASCMTATYIEPGTSGVVIDKLGDGIAAKPLGAGWHFVNPFSTRIEEMQYTNQTYAFSDADVANRLGVALKVNTIEGQRLDMNGSISLEVDPMATPALYGKFRRDTDGIMRTFVYPALVSATQSVVGMDSVGNVLGKNKERVRALVQQRLTDTLGVYGFRVAQFVLGEVGANPDVVKAINDKNVMQQEVLTVQTETQKRIQKARGDSVEAALKATAILLEAQAKAQAAELLSRAGSNAAFLQVQALENQKLAIEKWKGDVPQWSTGGNSPIPFINIQSPR